MIQVDFGSHLPIGQRHFVACLETASDVATCDDECVAHRPSGDQPEHRALQVFIDPEHAAGVWANFARVNHSEHEFTLDFIRIDYSTDNPVTGVVVARVAVSPLFITQLISALQDNWEKYAKKAMPREVQDADDG